jgi:adenosine deaminase
MPIPRELIAALPKTDLHCHLDGSLRPATLWELAREQGVELGVSTIEELRERLMAPEGGDLGSYIRMFDLTLSVLQDSASLDRVAYELAEDSHRENVRYLEVRYAPNLHARRGMTHAGTIDAVVSGLRRAERDFGIVSGVIICGIRTIPPEESLALAELTVTYKTRGVVGFDLAGEERDYPAKKHLQAFYTVLNHNVNVTVHAGEAFGAPSIHQAIHYCGAHRIGHGTHLAEDPDLLEYVNDHRIPLEMCLSSNVHTGASPSIEGHPFRDYFAKGLRVTLNTDNRLMSNTTSTQELELACDAFDLSIYDIRRVLINGLKSSFLPHARKKQVLRDAITEMDELFARFYPGQYDKYRTFL